MRVLGISDHFSSQNLEHAFNVQRNKCVKGINDALNDSIKQTYTVALQDVISAYQILVPYINESFLDDEQHNEDLEVNDENKIDNSRIDETTVQNTNDLFNRLYVIFIIIILTVFAYFIGSFEVNHTSWDNDNSVSFTISYIILIICVIISQYLVYSNGLHIKNNYLKNKSSLKIIRISLMFSYISMVFYLLKFIPDVTNIELTSEHNFVVNSVLTTYFIVYWIFRLIYRKNKLT